VSFPVADVCNQTTHTVDMQTGEGPGIFQSVEMLSAVSTSV